MAIFVDGSTKKKKTPSCQVSQKPCSGCGEVENVRLKKKQLFGRGFGWIKLNISTLWSIKHTSSATDGQHWIPPKRDARVKGGGVKLRVKWILLNEKIRYVLLLKRSQGCTFDDHKSGRSREWVWNSDKHAQWGIWRNIFVRHTNLKNLDFCDQNCSVCVCIKPLLWWIAIESWKSPTFQVYM